MDELNDIHFVQRLRAGDQSAFKVLFDQLSPKLCAFIFRLVENHHDAEELTADTMLKVHKSIQKFDPNGSAKLTTWIFKFAKNTAIDHLRLRKSLKEKLLIEPIDPVKEQDVGNRRAVHRESHVPANQPISSENSEESSSQLIAFNHALNSLSEEDQDILRMRTIMSYEEISQALNVAVGTLRVRHNRAVARLKTAYRKGGG